MTNTSGAGKKRKEVHPGGKEVICIQLAEALERSGQEFWKWVQGVEGSGVFRKLHQPAGNSRIIRINPIQHYCIHPRDTTDRSMNLKSIRSVFNGRPPLYNHFVNIGWRRFYYYFIEGNGTAAERAELLKVPYKETEVIGSTICKLLSEAGIHGPGSEDIAGIIGKNGEIVAEVLFPDSNMHVSYTYPKTRYVVDEEKLYPCMAEGLLSDEEIKEYYILRRNLDSINYRYRILFEVLEQALGQQKQFLMQGEQDLLVELEEQAVAEKINAHPSWVSRLVKNKYLAAQQRFVLLKDLFVSHRCLYKQKGKERLGRILKRQNQRLKARKISRAYSDEELRLQLESEFNLVVSRRTINNWKREIEREENNGTDDHMGSNR